jgi:hypothetical protein
MIKLISSKTGRLALSLIILVVSPLFISAGCQAANQLAVVSTNQAPVISGLTAKAESVRPSSSTQVNCDAGDPNRDTLTYTWSASGGTISGEGATVNWTAPDKSGAYTIAVTVSDGKGGEAAKETTVNVLAETNAPPVIQDVTTVPVSREVGDDKTVTLTCIAVDPAGYDIVDYLWDPVGGSIEGDGPTVVWTPPLVPERMQAAVLLRVTDSKGNRSMGAIIYFTILPILPCPS